ncbi:MAG TPA: type II secretion system protein [Phycisphaerae bacterium]|nr:type II secretion system protein [Phycisphaerae bacterium]
MSQLRRLPRGRRQAFTLVELLVVVTIIGILIGVLLPALGTVMQYAENIECQSNLKQIATAVLSYATDYQGAILPTKVEPADLYWCNLLAMRDLPSQNSVNLPTEERSRQKTVFLCPTSTELYVRENDASDETGAFNRPDHNIAQGWYRVGNDTLMTDCSYYWNGYVGTDTTQRERFPSLRVDNTAPNPLASYHNIAEIAQCSNMAMVADGIFWLDYSGNERPQRIAARHPGAYGARLLTNVAFWDGHVESLDRYAEGNYPNRDWTKERPADQIDDPVENWEWIPIMTRSNPLEGGPPFFMLPKR